MADMITWQLTGTLDGATVNAEWDDERGGLVADPALYEAVLDHPGFVQATPTGPTFASGCASSDQAWATVRACLAEVTGQFGTPPGYPWGVPDDAIC